MDHDSRAESRIEVAEELLRHVVVSLVRRDGIALSTQQFGVFLACYLCEEAKTVRGLVQELEIPRLVVSRALDKLTELDLIRREPDPRDARNQRLIQTTAGHEMLSELHRMTAEAELPTI